MTPKLMSNPADRYITTPLTLLLLREMALDLVREGRSDAETTLHLLTQDLHVTNLPGTRGKGRSVPAGYGRQS